LTESAQAHPVSDGNKDLRSKAKDKVKAVKYQGQYQGLGSQGQCQGQGLDYVKVNGKKEN